jgi:penicillin-binding protein 1C
MILNGNHQGTKAPRINKSSFLALSVCLVVLGLGGAAVVGFRALTSPPGVPPSFQEVRRAYAKSDAVLLDRHGEIIHELRVNAQGRRLDWVSLAEISPALISAAIRAEDKRFYQHHGTDWLSLAGALRELGASPNARGASTITMQLAAKLDRGLEPRGTRRSVRQKIAQIRAAGALERRWTKAEILEAYLNLVTFRGELEGLSAASSGLFRKKPHGLDQLESVLLASLIRSPNASIDSLGARACRLSAALGLALNSAEIVSRARDTFSPAYYVPPQAALAPHVALQLLESIRSQTGRDPAVIPSTLDGPLQRFAAETLRHHLEAVRPHNVHDGAVLVVDNPTGEVLAYVGNDGDRASARHVDGVRAPRQAGSTLKPFVYAAAFERRLLTPASLIEDSPLEVPAAGGVYRPQNYDRHFHGTVAARQALAASLNVPAVKALNLVGVEVLIEKLKALGFRGLRTADYYGPSLALGSADVTLWDLTNAYRTLANRGTFSPLKLGFEKTPGLPAGVFSPEAAFQIADILSDREGRSLTFSLESPLSTRFWTAVKTGTSKDMRDNWCVGFSDRYTVGVWAGNFSGEPMWDVTGVTGAAPAWVEIMNWLHSDKPSIAPRPPPGVIRRTVDFPAAGTSRPEWFIRGTESASILPAAGPAGFRIAYPSAGTIVALDPDIPPDRQKLFFEAEPANDSCAWMLDGRVLGTAGSVLLWTPEKGKHTLSLVDRSGRVEDTVGFEVRGNIPGGSSK